MQEAATQQIYTETVFEGDTPEILNSIWSPECAVAIYHRNPEADFKEWIGSIPPTNLPKARLSLKPNQVWGTITDLCAQHGLVEAPQCQTLIDDIATLAKTFAQVMDVKTINLRLDVVEDNACRRFHQDNVAARLICTYRGRGTEYGSGLSGTIPKHINQLPSGSAGIFRGRLWLDSALSSIVHRSPPIKGSGETRLLLVIDTPTEDELS